MPLFTVPFVGSLVTLFVLERIIHVILLLLLPTQRLQRDEKRAAKGVVEKLIDLLASLVFSTLNLILSAIRIVGTFLVWFLVMFIVLSLVWVTYEEYPVIWLHGASFYNARIGPIVYSYLVMPLRVSGLFGKAILPIYDSVVYVITYLLTHGLLPLVWEQTQAFVHMVLALLQFGRTGAASIRNYSDETTCETLEQCLRLTRDLDVVTPVGSIRSLGVVGVSLFGNVCGLFKTPLQFLLYPLFDHSFASALHNLLNAALHLFVQAPIITAKRSAASALGNGLDVLRTTPDLEPFWVRLIAGVTDAGNVLDHWIGAAVAVAFHGTSDDDTLLGGCQAREGENLLTQFEKQTDGQFIGGLHGQVAVLGLTDWLMATSNGTKLLFHGPTGSASISSTWPTEVDVSFGLAAVRYSETSGAGAPSPSGQSAQYGAGGRHTTDAMGCRCVDSAEGIRVSCAILPYAPGLVNVSTQTHTFDVPFQDNTWVTALTCDAVEISVRSVRWPVTRYEGTSTPFSNGNAQIPSIDCVSRGTCESVDATIWLVPKCSSTTLAKYPELCSVANVAVGTTCFPYCMAARIADTENQPPVFTNAYTWQTGKHLVGMDCLGLSTTASSGGLSVGDFLNPFSSSMLNPVSSGFSGAAAVGQSRFITAAQGTTPLGCTNVRQTGASTVRSWIHDGGSAESVPYLRATGQPFAITGDTVLVSAQTPDSSTQRVLVERFTGDQRDVYSMRGTQMTLQGVSSGPAATPETQANESAYQGTVLVPFAFQEARTLATNSRDYVFYAVPPPLHIFSAYIDWCSRSGDDLPQFQFMMLSSYTSLSVYRVRAYCQASCDQGRLSTSVAFRDFAADGFNSHTFDSTCKRRFNVTAVSMDYVNEQNIAMVMLECDAQLDLSHAPPVCLSGPVYATYWLHPVTMQVRRGGPWPTLGTSPGIPQPCDDGVGLPPFGTMLSQAALMGIHFTRFIVDGVVYTPGMLAHWRAGGVCGLSPMGHSVIASCGNDYLSLDDFLDASDQSVQLFWSIPRWVARVINAQGGVSPIITTWLQGGANTKAAENQHETGNLEDNLDLLFHPPIEEETMNVLNAVRGQEIWISGTSTSMACLSSIRFWARIVRRLAIDTGRRIAVADTTGMASGTWRDTVNVLYGARTDWNELVMNSARDGCDGVAMLLGYTNPWARLAHKVCMSGPLLVDAVYD